MKMIWNWIDKRDFTNEGKIRTFLFLNCVIFGLLGFIVWLFMKPYLFNSIEGALCFTGYSVFGFGFLGGFIFLCKVIK